MPTIFRHKVVVGGVTFNDRLDMPAGAIDWGLDTLDGWDRTSEIEVNSTPIGGGSDGEISAEVFPAKARHILVSGWALAPDAATAEQLADVLWRDVFPRNQEIVLARYEAIPKYLTVRVAGQREISRVGPLNFRWLVPVMAPDPFKYDLLPDVNSSGTAGVAGQSSGGRTYPRMYPLTYIPEVGTGEENAINIFNRGTGNTSPTITVHGPLVKGGWRISNETTGEDLGFDVALSSSDVLTIDFGAEVALLNGYPITSTLSGDFWKVVPGLNVIKLYGDYDPLTSITVSIKSAWE